MTVKIRLKGHESFYIREGWLKKCIEAINNDSQILSKDDAIDILGIGSNMVKAMRYWLPVTGLTEEIKGVGARKLKLTNGFGNIIFEYDKYFEDIGTLALLHYKICNNFEMATSWYLFFNKISMPEIKKNDLPGFMEEQLLQIDPECVFSKKSLIDDCNCIIKSYCLDKEDLKNPEDNLLSPFTRLGLINKSKINGHQEVLKKCSVDTLNIDKLVILYIILDKQSSDVKMTTIERLYNEDGNIGKVFNLSKNQINEYLDELEKDEYVTVNRTAGLNTVYINEFKKDDILIEYYSKRMGA